MAALRDHLFTRATTQCLRREEEKAEGMTPDVPPLVTAVRARDLEAVRAALAAGESPRRLFEGETPLHVAARYGPLAVVEALIEGGALEWQLDATGRTALDVARSSEPLERDAIIPLLDRYTIRDPRFRPAVDALHAGDETLLQRMVDADPALLHDRIVGPEAYRRRNRADYFRDPKLFWFVANNPTTVERMPANIVAMTQAMIERGVEQEDLDYTLELVMSSSVAREQGHQLPLMQALLAAGAHATREAIVVAAAHWELEPLYALVADGMPLDAPLAAAFGDVEHLAQLLPQASADDVQLAFGLAVINRQLAAAKLALEAGADVNAFLPAHSHSTALHQAAALDDAAMIEMLLAADARTDIRDTLWDGTAFGWARHSGNEAAAEALEAAKGNGLT